MKLKTNWQLMLGLFLIVATITLHYLHFVIFHDAHHVFIYLLGDIAFLPLEVLIVTLIIHRLLSHKEKQSKLEKLNMVIGVFFSELGVKLLSYLSDSDPGLNEIKSYLVVDGVWDDREFMRVQKILREYSYNIDKNKIDWVLLIKMLREKRDFLLRLLENPVLLEHECFTELLRSVFHLTEELESRDDFSSLPESDLEHMAGDIKRVYTNIISEWLKYMLHLKRSFPYLFSLAMRANPFDSDSSVVVR
ncbi:MAG: hypothetical protein P9X27_03115 [Candidatus Kaelpia aquatica]|nr:hypothetical protein [Candidatus Kaelpia aquatica]